MKPICRLFVDAPLTSGVVVQLADVASNYITNVLRARVGDAVAVFNGRDGEWLARVSVIAKRSAELQCVHCLRPQQPSPDIHLLFAPVKNEKLDFLVARACELGVSAIRPVITARTIASRVNLERMAKNLIEAAEQCGRLDVPVLLEPLPLAKALATLEGRLLLHADESGAGATVKDALPTLTPQPAALLTGPEGGFTDDERELIRRSKPVLALSLGPRIMRAETAVIAGLASLMPWLGDWQHPPSFQALA